MASRQVTRTGKDRDGDITALCGDWGRTEKSQAIRDIEMKWHTYYVRDYLGTITYVGVVTMRNGDKYLRTNPNMSERDNLDYLPNC
jgi:hypothetical protein